MKERFHRGNDNMCINELSEQFEIQGCFIIKVWKDDISDYEILAKGKDFELDKLEINEEILEKEITYMFANDGVLNIEVKDIEE